MIKNTTAVTNTGRKTTTEMTTTAVRTEGMFCLIINQRKENFIHFLFTATTKTAITLMAKPTSTGLAAAATETVVDQSIVVIDQEIVGDNIVTKAIFYLV